MNEMQQVIAADHWNNGPRELSTYTDLGPFVYYIQCGEFIKIGTSINPEARVRQLDRGGKAMRPSTWAGNPKLIAYLPGNVNKERALHHQFAAQRDRGEWFVMNQELIDHVTEAQTQQCLTEIGIHNKRYEDNVRAGKWPARNTDLAAAFRDHLASKDSLETEALRKLSA